MMPRSRLIFAVLLACSSSVFSSLDAQAQDAAEEPTVLTPGTHTFSFTEALPTTESGAYVQRFRFTVEANRQVQIDQESEAVDSILRLVDAEGETVETNDDRGDGTYNSRIVFFAAEAQTYTVECTTYGEGETGACTLTLSVSTPPLVAAGQVVEGVLEPDDANTPVGGGAAFSDAHYIELRAGARYVFTLRSEAFDTYLSLSPAGEPLRSVAQNDDIATGDTNSQIVVDIAEDGLYVLTVRSYESGMEGPYALTIEGGK